MNSNKANTLNTIAQICAKIPLDKYLSKHDNKGIAT
jgi:hypothetical protein